MPSSTPRPAGPSSQGSNSSNGSANGRSSTATPSKKSRKPKSASSSSSAQNGSSRGSRNKHRSTGSSSGAARDDEPRSGNGSGAVISTKKLDETAKYYINYGVLALHDSRLGQIFLSTTVCNIYIYDHETEGWNKSYCQGPLFLYSRVVSESSTEDAKTESDGDPAYGEIAPYALVALNRLSLDNFSLAITPKSLATKRGVETVGMYRDGDFLIAQSPDDVTYGIYLYKEEERTNLLATVEWCLDVDL